MAAHEQGLGLYGQEQVQAIKQQLVQLCHSKLLHTFKTSNHVRFSCAAFAGELELTLKRLQKQNAFKDY